MLLDAVRGHPADDALLAGLTLFDFPKNSQYLKDYLTQVVELNTFFVKHVFPMPPAHPICVARMLAMAVWAAPSARQYYSFVTDPR